MTPRQVARELSDVPLATIYRHVNTLHQAGLIEVVQEKRIHGTLERQFAIVESANYLRSEEMTADDILGLVAALTGVVQSQFQRYVQRAVLPPKDSEIGFVTKLTYFTDEEYARYRALIKEVIMRSGRPSAPEYHRRFIAFFTAPVFEDLPLADEDTSDSA